MTAIGAVVALAAVLGLGVASVEWFSRDDFAFLLQVQRPWSWVDAFLPLESRFWWSWRPLGMDTWFRLAHRAFGLDATVWFAVALGVHFARLPLVWRLARQMGMRGPAPWLAAALSVVAHPSLTELYYASVFHYASAAWLGTLSLTLLLDAAHGRRWAAPASALAYAAALLCNESALVLAPVAVLLGLHAQGFGRLRTAVPRALWIAAPHVALAAAWLVLRFAVIAAKPVPAWYGPYLRWGSLLHFWNEPAWLAGGGGRLAALLLLLLGALAFVLRRSGPGDPVRRALLHANAVLLPWLLAATAMFAGLPFAQPRFAIPLEVPAALWVGAFAHALWRRLGARHGGALQLAFLMLVVLALPFAQMRERLLDPRGGIARRYVQDVARLHPQLPQGVRIRILHGGEGRADARQARRFRVETHRGQALRVAYPELRPGRLEMVDTTRRPPPPPCPRCLTFDLGPDLRVRPAAPPAR